MPGCPCVGGAPTLRHDPKCFLYRGLDMADIVDLNAERREQLTGVLRNIQTRIDAGETVALAFVEVQRNNTVHTITDGGGEFYHQLNSGAARLAWLLAGYADDTEEYLDGA